MFTMTVPKYLWGDAILTDAYLINRLPSRTINFDTPISLLSKSYPHLSNSYSLPLKTFGCTAFVHVHDHHRNKLDLRSIKTVFIGYSPTQKGYRCYYPQTGKIFVSRDVTFFEDKAYFSPTSLHRGKPNPEAHWDSSPILGVSLDTTIVSIPDQVQDIPHLTSPSHVPVIETGGESTPQQELQVYSRRKKLQVDEDIVNPTISQQITPVVDPRSGTCHDLNIPIAIRKGEKSCTQHPISNFVSYLNLSDTFRAFTSSLSNVIIPRSIQETLTIHEWRTTVLEEMNALKLNQTWNLVERPKGKNLVGCKWVFTVK